MDQAARGCVTAAAVLTAASLVAALPVAKPALPDVQVRDTDLIANVSDLQGAAINALYEHIQQEFSGNADQTPAIGSELLPDQDSSGLGGIGNAILNGDGLTLDENSASNLIGAALDPSALVGGDIAGIVPPDVPSIGGSVPGVLNGNDPATAAVVNFLPLAALSAGPALQAAYQTFTQSVIGSELVLNNALVNSQLAAVDRLSDLGEVANKVANLLFTANNLLLAQNENGLNTLLGANFDPSAIQSSLLSAFNAENMSLSDWAAMLGITPDELTQIVNAAAAGNLSLLLGDVDWLNVLANLF